MLRTQSLQICPKLSLLLTISEDVHVRDAEHGVSPVLLRRSRVPALCERGPEAAAEAAPELRWPRCPIQCKEAPNCPSLLFLYVTVHQAL